MMNRVEMNDEMMEQVNGGFYLPPSEEEDYWNAIHPGCGGHINHQYNPFVNSECDRCGESHYLFCLFYGNHTI